MPFRLPANAGDLLFGPILQAMAEKRGRAERNQERATLTQRYEERKNLEAQRHKERLTLAMEAAAQRGETGVVRAHQNVMGIPQPPPTPDRTMTRYAEGNRPQMGGAVGDPAMGQQISAELQQGTDLLGRIPGATAEGLQTAQQGPFAQQIRDRMAPPEVTQIPGEERFTPTMDRARTRKGEIEGEKKQARDEKFRAAIAGIAAKAGAPETAIDIMWDGLTRVEFDKPDLVRHLTDMGVEIDKARKAAERIAGLRRSRGQGRRPERMSNARVNKLVHDNNRKGFVRAWAQNMIPELPSSATMEEVNESWRVRRSQKKAEKKDSVRLKALKVKEKTFTRKIASLERAALKPALAYATPDDPARVAHEKKLGDMNGKLDDVVTEMNGLEGLSEEDINPTPATQNRPVKTDREDFQDNLRKIMSHPPAKRLELLSKALNSDIYSPGYERGMLKVRYRQTKKELSGRK